MIHLPKERATVPDIQDMLEQYEDMIKIVVDIRRYVLSGGGETAAELVRMQTMITLWQHAWGEASQNPQQRLLRSVQAKDWSDKAIDFSGLV